MPAATGAARLDPLLEMLRMLGPAASKMQTAILFAEKNCTVFCVSFLNVFFVPSTDQSGPHEQGD